MIDEVFLRSAVNIRRQYLKISNNMEFYHNRAKEVVEKLEKTLKDLETLQEKFKTDRNSSTEESITKLMDIIKEVEEEGERLEKLVDPMNKEIEVLSKEEHELYRQIKEKHHNLTDDEIVSYVQNRLIKEGL